MHNPNHPKNNTHIRHIHIIHSVVPPTHWIRWDFFDSDIQLIGKQQSSAMKSSAKKDITWYVNSIHNCWLLVWNMFYFPIYWEESSSQVTNSYFSERLVETTNHIYIYISYYIILYYIIFILNNIILYYIMLYYIILYYVIFIYDIIFPVGYHWYIIDISMRTMWFSEDHSPFGPWEVLDAGSIKDDADQG